MSFCSKCGTQIESATQQFCTNCGAKVENQPYVSPAPIEVNQEQAPVYEQSAPVQNTYGIPQNPIVQHPMKWFKFLIYFALFLGAFINFVYGLNYITGGIYFSQTNGQVSAEMVYSTYGAGLKTLDVIQGILMVAIAAFGIYTRFRLAKFKANGPLCVYILYGAGAALTLLYNVALLVVTGLNQLTTVSSITSLVVSVGFILLNYAYFTKRKDLFIN